jgi:hypothetical protein
MQARQRATIGEEIHPQPGSNVKRIIALSDCVIAVVSTVAQFIEQTWTVVVLAALDQSGLPAFLLYSSRLFRQVISASAHRLDRAPAGPALAPPLFVQAHLPAGLACQSLPGRPSDRLLPSDL